MRHTASLIFSPDFHRLGRISRTKSSVAFVVDGEVDLGEITSLRALRKALTAHERACGGLHAGVRVSWSKSDYLLTIAEIRKR